MNPVENRLYETDDTMKAICARSVACIGSLDAQETNRSTHGPVDGYVFFFSAIGNVRQDQQISTILVADTDNFNKCSSSSRENSSLIPQTFSSGVFQLTSHG
jgi:hypothetical protein